MIFSNDRLSVQDALLSNGVRLRGFAIGKALLPTVGLHDHAWINNGMNKKLSIRLTSGGYAYVKEVEEEDLYMILTSDFGGWGDPQNHQVRGSIHVPRKQKIQLVDRAGFVYDRERKGDVVVVKADDGDIFKVDWAGAVALPRFYVVKGGEVFTADEPHVADLCEVIGVKMPFDLAFKRNRFRLFRREWKRVK